MANTVLVVGGTGRVGSLVVQQLLSNGHHVRAIIRSPQKVPPDVTSHPNFTLIRGTILDLPPSDLQTLVKGCDAVICTLGHVISLAGVFGPPYLLVTTATKRLCAAIEATKSVKPPVNAEEATTSPPHTKEEAGTPPVKPTKYILLNTVGVSNPSGDDRKRGWFESGFLWLIGFLPPLTDSLYSARFLVNVVGTQSPYVEWSVVRPDAFVEGDVSPLAVHERLQSSLFNPGHTRMANIAKFMCDLSQEGGLWETWKFKMPVILDAQ